MRFDMTRLCKGIANIVALLAMDLASNANCQETVSNEQRGPATEIIQNDAGHNVVSKGESPPESNPAVDEANPAAAKPDYPLPLSSAEMAEREWLARKEFKTTVFFASVAIAAVVLIAAFVLPAVVRGRKPAASKVPPTGSP
jgi:hypothetical protein